MQRVLLFLENIRPRVEQYLKGKLRLPAWDPSAHYYTKAVKHVEPMRIPDLGYGPDLLLHELGNWDKKPEISERLKKIFCEGQNT